MSADIEEFTETLNAEQYVDLQKLRSYARYGIPPGIRGEVWLYLLGVLSPDRTNEITSVRSKYSSYTSMDKLPPAHSHRLRSECTRYYNRRLVPYARRRRQTGIAPNAINGGPSNNAMIRMGINTTTTTTTTTTTGGNTSTGGTMGKDLLLPSSIGTTSTTLDSSGLSNKPLNTTSKTTTTTTSSSFTNRTTAEEEPMDIMAFTTSVENVLSAYLNRNLSTDYQPALVPLVAPFVWTLKTEAGMYFCFERLMTIIEEYTTKNTLSNRLTFFMQIFRQFLPDLFSYFEEEAVDTRELATAWLTSLFSREMNIGMLMRLWDVYFSIQDPLELHPFVCLAILTNCKDALEELDQSEVRSMLLNLPGMDVDRLIVEAYNLRLSYQHSQTRGGGERTVDY